MIDHNATPDDAASIGDAVIELLISERMLLDTPNSECVLNGVGYPPGPRLSEIYNFADRELAFWSELTVNGVKVHAERYVNFFAFPVFEHAICPACKTLFSDDESVMDQLYDCVGHFINDDRLNSLRCPKCSVPTRCDHWTTKPDVGLSYLGIEFWNWAPLSHSGWTLSIPELISNRLGRTMSNGWGKL
ncbi:hypothetical protein [Novipirellula sp.]|uniref:hypothetical protein n=1 Tax=Novipirellula sp. TaxID=2795430 RepID=UPI00356B2A2C